MTVKHRQLHRTSGRLLAFAVGLVLMAGASRTAHAQTELAPYEPQPMPFATPAPRPSLFAPPAPLVTTRSWYGYQLMLSDLASIVLMFTGEQGARIGVGGFFVAPPVIHAVHHNVGMAVASPLMRVGLPLLGAVIGASAESCSDSHEDSWCGFGGAVAGLGIGLLTAMILDYCSAWEERPLPSPMPPAGHHPPRLSLTTAGVAPTNNGATLVLGGRF